jgi:hypothetical protein
MRRRRSGRCRRSGRSRIPAHGRRRGRGWAPCSGPTGRCRGRRGGNRASGLVPRDIPRVGVRGVCAWRARTGGGAWRRGRTGVVGAVGGGGRRGRRGGIGGRSRGGRFWRRISSGSRARLLQRILLGIAT